MQNSSKQKRKPEDSKPAEKTKKCHICGQMKPVSEFNFLQKNRGRHMTVCKECEHDQKRQLREKKRAILDDLKTVGCACCGESDPVCLDFHHWDPDEKEFNMSSALTKPMDKMMIEASKCVVVCSNCHRKIHSGQIDVNTIMSRHEYEYRKRLVLHTLAQAALIGKKKK